MMSSKYLILTFFLCVDWTLGCDFDSYNRKSVCTSVESAAREGTANWHVLKIKNNGNEPLNALKRDGLRNSPNLVEITIVGSINRIHRDALRGLDKLEKLELFENKINTLPAELFQNVPIQNFYLINSSLTTLKPGTFEDVNSLRALYIRYNNIKLIPSKTFSGDSIEQLYIEYNGIEEIEDFAFINMPNLIKLSLAGNQLKSFDVRKILGSNSLKLDKLWLSKNNLTMIKKNMFALLPRLQHLFLEMNEIYAIEDGAFNGLDNLVILDISNNKLWNVPSYIFPPTGLNVLQIFLTHNNRLTFLKKDIFDLAPQLKYVSTFGNPLQCPCTFLIEEYFGKRNISQVCKDNNKKNRPVCLYTKDNSQICSYDLEKNKILYSDFIELTKDYEPWDTKCLFAEGYENIYWSTIKKIDS